MSKKVLLILIVSAMAVFSGFAGGSSESKEEKVYVFASNVTWAPMEYIDANGDMVGFDIDLLASIAEAADFKYEIRNTGWDGIFAGLASGSYDAVISSVTITEERKAAMNFSLPYVNAGQILVVRSDYSGGDELADFADMKVGAQQGTTGDFAIEEIPAIDRRAYDDIGLAIEDLVNGNIDAVVCDSITAIDYVVTNANFTDKLKVLGKPFTSEEYGIAISKDNTELLEKVNMGIKEVFANGTQKALVEKWLR